MHQFNKFVAEYNNACKSYLKYFKFQGYNSFILKFCYYLYINGIIKEYILLENSLYIFIKSDGNTRSYPRIYSMFKKKNPILIKKTRSSNNFFGLTFFTNSEGLHCTNNNSKSIHGLLVAYVI